ncbi:MAG: serpin family protein [Hyperionvirus sp.]|uniref:Serpin family protein n=1 Tax=Hyperionvirus sp. TaxID=2487770 RepID=A0A3G5A5F9_9VIRU|nr:MAG: serpin family protein [Hyperionvirus sp.]
MAKNLISDDEFFESLKRSTHTPAAAPEAFADESFFELMRSMGEKEEDNAEIFVAVKPKKSESMFYILFDTFVKNKSHIYSPLSVEEALLSFYVSDEKRQPLESVYAKIIPAGVEAISYYRSCNEKLESSSSVVNISNSIWVNKSIDFTLDEKFQAKVAPLCAIHCVPFDEKLQGLVNDWVNEKTKGMIETAPEIPTGDVDLGAIMINTIFFQGKFKIPFNEAVPGLFTGSNGNSKMLNMMIQRFDHTCGYYENSGLKAIQLYYEDQYSLVVILSKGGVPNPVEKELWEIIGKTVRDGIVLATIPEFTSESELSLVDPILSLTSPEIIGPYNDIGSKPLKIKCIIQKAKIEMNRFGTKAAAVTVVAAYPCCASASEKYYEFHANVPFNYYIVHEPTRKVLFMGAFHGECSPASPFL